MSHKKSGNLVTTRVLPHLLVQKDPTPGAETSQRPPSEGLLLRLTEFILPPPHPSGKKSTPGVNCYDQIVEWSKRLPGAKSQLFATSWCQTRTPRERRGAAQSRLLLTAS